MSQNKFSSPRDRDTSQRCNELMEFPRRQAKQLILLDVCEKTKGCILKVPGPRPVLRVLFSQILRRFG